MKYLILIFTIFLATPTLAAEFYQGTFRYKRVCEDGAVQRARVDAEFRVYGNEVALFALEGNWSASKLATFYKGRTTRVIYSFPHRNLALFDANFRNNRVTIDMTLADPTGCLTMGVFRGKLDE
ncbi:MAG: hypothetical protein V3S01_06950 [Dehalococcoidia bacterium]